MLITEVSEAPLVVSVGRCLLEPQAPRLSAVADYYLLPLLEHGFTLKISLALREAHNQLISTRSNLAARHRVGQQGLVEGESADKCSHLSVVSMATVIKKYQPAKKTPDGMR